MRAVKMKQGTAIGPRQGRSQYGLGGAITRRYALQALASIGAVRSALGQPKKESFKTGLTVVGQTEGNVGAVHSLTLKPANADGRRRRTRGFRVGETVEVCFTTEQPGFVSLWSQDAEGILDRLVPNRYTLAAAESVPVRAGRTYCVSSDGRLAAEDGAAVAAGTGKYRIEVREPVGHSELLLYWTEDPLQQPEAELAVDIDALDKSIEKRKRGSGKYRGVPPRESLTIEFEIEPELSF